MTDDLLAAAFGALPDAAVPAGGPPRQRWLAAVVLGGQGHYAAAAARLRPLLGGRAPVLAALAATTMASHLRQLGGHAAARRLDAEAARRLAAVRGAPRPADPYGADHAGAVVDVLLGLAADAIGLGRTGEAGALLARARQATASPDTSWRLTVRVHWIATELALAEGRPADAAESAERAEAVASDSGAVRHTVKSTMMRGAALASGGTPDGRRDAEALLTGALGVSLKRGMHPLAWPCALLLADLVPDRAPDLTKIGRDALTCVYAQSDPAMQRISARSPWMPTALIRSGEPTRTGGRLTT